LQELLAAQLIQSFTDIFQECSLPLYLRFYEVLVTSNRTALIELVPDALSIHTIKAKGPPNASLSDHFFAKFGRAGPECEAAQRAFAESMAAYSLVCYLLQIKVPPGTLILPTCFRATGTRSTSRSFFFALYICMKFTDLLGITLKKIR